MSLQDPIHLALSGKQFASLTPEEIEAINRKNRRPTLRVLLDKSFLLSTLGIHLGEEVTRKVRLYGNRGFQEFKS